MISPVLFWIVAVLTVVPALALLWARKPVHIAMAVVTAMVGLAVAYVALEAPFLGVVQVIVYTGAVMMMFVFVLMLVGVDRRESLKETIAGQKWVAYVGGLGLLLLLITVLQRADLPGLRDGSPAVGNPEAIADLLFTKYVLVMEALGFLLISAAVGAIVLTHVPKIQPRKTQKELQAERIKTGLLPGARPMPGVYARNNALDMPALDPQGNPISASESRVLRTRQQTSDPTEVAKQVKQRRQELGYEGDEA